MGSPHIKALAMDAFAVQARPPSGLSKERLRKIVCVAVAHEHRNRIQLLMGGSQQLGSFCHSNAADEAGGRLTIQSADGSVEMSDGHVERVR